MKKMLNKTMVFLGGCLFAFLALAKMVSQIKQEALITTAVLLGAIVYFRKDILSLFEDKKEEEGGK